MNKEHNFEYLKQEIHRKRRKKNYQVSVCMCACLLNQKSYKNRRKIFDLHHTFDIYIKNYFRNNTKHFEILKNKSPFNLI